GEAAGGAGGIARDVETEGEGERAPAVDRAIAVARRIAVEAALVGRLEPAELDQAVDRRVPAAPEAVGWTALSGSHAADRQDDRRQRRRAGHNHPRLPSARHAQPRPRPQ